MTTCELIVDELLVQIDRLIELDPDHQLLDYYRTAIDCDSTDTQMVELFHQEFNPADNRTDNQMLFGWTL